MKRDFFAFTALVLLFTACTTVQPESSKTENSVPDELDRRIWETSSDELDRAIRETSDYLNKQLSKGNKIVILNIQSEFPALSESMSLSPIRLMIVFFP